MEDSAKAKRSANTPPPVNNLLVAAVYLESRNEKSVFVLIFIVSICYDDLLRQGDIRQDSSPADIP